MNSTKDTIELIIGISALLGIIWQISQVKAAIDKAIDAVQDEALARHSALEKRLDIHLESYFNKREQDERNFAELKYNQKKNFGQLREHQKDIERYLSKDGFTVRTHYTTDHEFPKKQDL